MNALIRCLLLVSAVVWIYGPTCLSGQAISDASVRAQYDSAVYLLRQGTQEGLQKAETLLVSALEKAESSGDSVGVGFITSQLGVAKLFAGSPSDALRYLRRAIPRLENHPVELTETHLRLGGTHGRLSSPLTLANLDSVKVHLRSATVTAASTGDSLFMTRVNLDVGTQLLNLGKYSDAEPFLKRAYEHASVKSYTQLQLRAILNYAILQNYLQRRTGAFNLYKEARAFAESTEDTLGVARAELVIGELRLDNRQYGAAVPHLEQAARLADPSTPLGLELHGRALWNLSIAQYQTRQFAAALQTLRFLEKLPLTPENNAPVQTRIALMLVNLRRLSEARTQYVRADSLVRLAFTSPMRERELAGIEINRGILEALARDTARAIRHFHNGVQFAERPGGDSTVLVQALMGVANLIRPIDVDSALSLYLRGLAIQRTRTVFSMLKAGLMQNIAVTFHRWKQPRDLARATAYYDSAAVMALGVVPGVGGDAEQVSVTEGTAEWFGYAARAWAERSTDPAVGPARAQLAALGAAERGRARVLLTQIQR
jgi:tetratricopeptide (TPR) repeat protein